MYGRGHCQGNRKVKPLPLAEQRAFVTERQAWWASVQAAESGAGTAHTSEAPRGAEVPEAPANEADDAAAQSLTHGYRVVAYSDATESHERGHKWFSDELCAWQWLDTTIQRGRWAVLEVYPWAEVCGEVRARLVLALGWEYTSRQAFRGTWARIMAGQPLGAAYHGYVERLDAHCAAGDEDGVKHEFRRLWAWLQSAS